MSSSYYANYYNMNKHIYRLQYEERKARAAAKQKEDKNYYKNYYKEWYQSSLLEAAESGADVASTASEEPLSK